MKAEKGCDELGWGQNEFINYYAVNYKLRPKKKVQRVWETSQNVAVMAGATTKPCDYAF